MPAAAHQSHAHLPGDRGDAPHVRAPARCAARQGRGAALVRPHAQLRLRPRVSALPEGPSPPGSRRGAPPHPSRSLRPRISRRQLRVRDDALIRARPQHLPHPRSHAESRRRACALRTLARAHHALAARAAVAASRPLSSYSSHTIACAAQLMETASKPHRRNSDFDALDWGSDDDGDVAPPKVTTPRTALDPVEKAAGPGCEVRRGWHRVLPPLALHLP